MTTAPVEPPAWSPLKWGVVVISLLAVQILFFYWFISPPGLPRRPLPAGLAVVMPDGQPAEPPGSVSPLVLVRPDAHGFSGRAWLQIPQVSYNPEESNPPPYLLQLEPDRLGAAITQTLSDNLSRPFEVAARPGPRFDDLSYSPIPAAPQGSTFAVEGDLAARPLLTKPVLRLQPADSILSNTVVYVAVDVQGRVFAPPVLASTESSGTASSADAQAVADADALAAAAGLLFQPLARLPGRPPPDPSSLTSGRVVFHWQTIPKAASTASDAAAH